MSTTARNSGAGLELPGLLPASLLAEDHSAGEVRPKRRSARDWLVDVLIFLAAMVIAGAGFFEAVHAHGFAAWRFADLAAGLVTTMSLWWRRRWPIELAAAATAASVFAASSGGALLALLFTVAVHRRYPVATALAVANIPAAAVYHTISPAPDMSWAWAMVFSAVLIAAVALWGMLVRARRQLIFSLRERAKQAEAEGRLRVEQARHRERERIAREMHDALAHRLSLLSVHANALAHRPGAPAADVVRASDVIRDNAHQALRDLRAVIGVLRTPDGGGLAGINDVTALAAESRAAGMRVTVTDHRPAGVAVPAAVSRCAHRLVQEALTNARKHAPGAAATISITGRPGDTLTVCVENEPPPEPRRPNPIPGTGSGLVGIAERVGLAGGTLSHGPTPAGGFQVSARLPWPT